MKTRKWRSALHHVTNLQSEVPNRFKRAMSLEVSEKGNPHMLLPVGLLVDDDRFLDSRVNNKRIKRRKLEILKKNDMVLEEWGSDNCCCCCDAVDGGVAIVMTG